MGLFAAALSITSSRKTEQQQKQQCLLVKKVGAGWS
jgi:hypothetical protein